MKRGVLFAGTIILTAHTRTRVQYGRSWESLYEALSSLAVHGVAVPLFVVITTAAIRLWAPRFLDVSEPEPSYDALYVSVWLVVLIATLCILFLGAWTRADLYTDPS